MRKYFLLSAVAILTATNVNAATGYAEVIASVEVETATKLTCSTNTSTNAWYLGKVLLAPDFGGFASVSYTDVVDEVRADAGVLQVDINGVYNPVQCQVSNGISADDVDWMVDDVVYFTGTGPGSPYMQLYIDNGTITGELRFEETVAYSGTYTASFSVMATY